MSPFRAVPVDFLIPVRIRRSRRVAILALAGVALSFSAGLAQTPPGTAAPARPRSSPAAEEVAGDPSDLFLKAFSAVQQAESLEREGKLRPALAKLRFAANLLDQIGQNHPNWQPLIVSYRSRKTADALTKLQDKLNAQAQAIAPSPAPGATSTSVPPPGNPPATTAAGRVNNTPEEDDPLPQPDHPAGSGPTVTTQAPNSPPPEAAVGQAAQAMRVRVDKLQAELRDARKQLESAQKEKKRLLDQLDAAEGDAKVAGKKAARTRGERDAMEAELEKAQARLREAVAKNPAAAETRRELRNQIARLRTALAKAQETGEESDREKEKLASRLAAAEKKNAAGTRGDLSKDATAKIESLSAENVALTAKLGAAEQTIAELSAEATRKREEAEAVQGELGKLREQLTVSRDQNDRSATQITELKKQLDDSADRLAQGVPKEELNKITKENDLLKTIALRLLKEQARRTQASKLVSEELARLEVQSRSLTEQLDLLGQPTVQLTDEERSLFKDPQINASDATNPNTLALSLVNVAQPGARTAGENGETAPLAGGSGAAPDAASGAAASPAPAGGGANAATADNGPAVQTEFKPPVPPELVDLAREAKTLLDRGRYGEAEEAYQKLIARAPKNAYALSNLGVALSRQGKLKTAEAQLKKAIALAPKDAFNYVTLGSIYYQMRKFDDALDSLTKACSLDPKNASAHNYLGITSSQKGWPEAAVDELEKAIALNPNYADAHFNLAVVYALNQPPIKEKAQLHYRRATALGAQPDAALERLIN